MNKIMDRDSCMNWLERNSVLVNAFISKRWHIEDYNFIWNRLIEDPVISRQAIIEFRRLNQDKLNDVVSFLTYGSIIALVSGKRGSGKSCTVHFLMKRIKEQFPDKRIFYIGPPMNIDESFEHGFSVYDTPEGSINVIDESALIANSRKSMGDSNISLTEILPTLRHVDKTVIVITQNSSMTDINFYKLADVMIIKQFSLMQSNTERDLFSRAFDLFVPQTKNEVFFYSDGLITNFSHAPDSNWNDNLSKAYRFIESEDEAKKYIYSLLDNDYKIGNVRSLLRVVGFNRPIGWYEEEFVRS